MEQSATTWVFTNPINGNNIYIDKKTRLWEVWYKVDADGCSFGGEYESLTMAINAAMEQIIKQANNL